MELRGTSIIGFRRGARHDATLRGFNPATGEQLETVYFAASDDEIEDALRLAAQSFVEYSRASGLTKARFLRKIADNIEALGDALFTCAVEETGLPAARIKSETGRTCFQLRLFAETVAEGSWVDARIDRADLARQPLPKPDVRSMLRAIGPVVVFGASNFPLAFSVAGGDTASALAAGCPVIVKAHPAHPSTSELVGLALLGAARECELPEGVFSLLYGTGNEIGEKLVRHPLTKAVGFTGSRAGGVALMKAAASRPEPIPFYAEMSSVNPVFILPGAMLENLERLAKGLHASVTLGAGQFCTNPGLVLIAEDEHAAAFAHTLGTLMGGANDFTMLTPNIGAAYRAAVDERERQAAAIVRQAIEPQRNACRVGATLFQTDAESFLEMPELGAEIFGPTTLLVKHANREQLLEIARKLEGHLTATVHGTQSDLDEFSDLIAMLENKVGRVVCNGFPTGVEVSHAMVHGGPFPATSDGRSTSVGTRAILRFARPVCYQDFPEKLLPDELKDNNPRRIWRLLDGNFSKEPATADEDAG